MNSVHISHAWAGACKKNLATLAGHLICISLDARTEACMGGVVVAAADGSRRQQSTLAATYADTSAPYCGTSVNARTAAAVRARTQYRPQGSDLEWTRRLHI